MKETDYWLADPDPERVAKKRGEGHGTWTIWNTNPISQAWVRNMLSYFSHVLDPNSWDTSLIFDGEQGELIRMTVPQARSLIRQAITLITNQKLAFKTMAKSMGKDTMNDVRLGDALADHITFEQRLDEKGEELLEMAMVLGGAFTLTKWNTAGGRPHTTNDDGSILYEGKSEISILTPLDVSYEYRIKDWNDMGWVECRVKQNKWSLIAQHPELEDEILKLPSIQSFQGSNFFNSVVQMEDDYVWVYELYARPTPALPAGRMMMYASDKCIFHDGANEYGTIPIEPCIPEKLTGAHLGVPFYSSLMPVQEMMDICFSAISTNNANLGVTNVIVPRGANINVEQIYGQNWISYTPQQVEGGGIPKALTLAQSAPETFKIIEVYHAHLQQMANISPALRGNPPPGVTSGTAFATLSANSLEFLKGQSKTYFSCLQRTMEHAINGYKKFGKIEHVMMITGKNSTAIEKAFTNKDLENVERVSITLQNPLMQTVAGRIEVAEKLIQTGSIKTPQDYLTVIEGGDLKELTSNETTENDLVIAENDRLMDGEKIFALWTDNHGYHVRKHKKLLDDPAVRAQGKQVQLVMDHIMEHVQLARQNDPFAYAMTQTAQIPMGGPPQGGPPPAAGPQGPEEAPPDQALPLGEPDMTDMTGEPAGPADMAKDLLGRAR